MGKSPIVGADRYYELHGLPSREPRYDYAKIPVHELRALRLPMINSVCVMLAHAIYEQRHESIRVLASPLLGNAERVEQRPAVAYLLGFADALGIRVYWEGGIDLSAVYMGGAG